MSEATGNRLEFKAGDIICRPGERIKNIFLIESGEVGIFHLEKEHLYLKDVKGETDIIGDDILFSEKRESPAIIAIKDTMVSCVKIEEIDYVLGKCPDWLGNILGLISDRLRSSRAVLDEHHIVPEKIENYQLTADQLQAFKETLLNS
jgi:CRP-like cAMP-binding protein